MFDLDPLRHGWTAQATAPLQLRVVSPWHNPQTPPIHRHRQLWMAHPV